MENSNKTIVPDWMMKLSEWLNKEQQPTSEQPAPWHPDGSGGLSQLEAWLRQQFGNTSHSPTIPEEVVRLMNERGISEQEAWELYNQQQ